MGQLCGDSTTPLLVRLRTHPRPRFDYQPTGHPPSRKKQQPDHKFVVRLL